MDAPESSLVEGGRKENEGIIAPKEQNSKTVNQFKTISLLDVEGEIFFAILAKRLTSLLTGNTYIDTSVQKGGVPGFSGCVEHTSAITQVIREAKEGRKDLAVVWLDLANTYVSIPHQWTYKAPNSTMHMTIYRKSSTVV